MGKIKVLYSDYSPPNEKTHVSLNLDNIFKELEKKQGIEKICVVYQPNKIEIKNISETQILDFNNFHNALEIIEKIKPDLIIGGGEPLSFINSALCIAGKFKNIPVVTIWEPPINDILFKEKIFRFTSFFQQNIPTDKKNEKNKKFMKRGRFFVKRLLFLLKTQHNTNYSIRQIIGYVLFYMKKIFFPEDVIFYPLFSADLHFVANKKIYSQLIKSGFHSKSVIITGLPMYDVGFQKINNIKNSFKSEKISVLFAPETLSEHNQWTKKQQDDLIKQIIISVQKHKEKIRLSIKIHPSYADISHYNKLISSLDPTIPIYHKEDFMDLLVKSNVFITFTPISSMVLYSIIAKKRTILCNTYPLSNHLLLSKNIVELCTNPSKLGSMILSPSIIEDFQSREKFLQDKVFSLDGKSSERICKHIINLLTQKFKTNK